MMCLLVECDATSPLFVRALLAYVTISRKVYVMLLSSLSSKPTERLRGLRSGGKNIMKREVEVERFLWLWNCLKIAGNGVPLVREFRSKKAARDK